MQPFCWGPLRVRWADRMLQADFLRPDAMPIRLKQMIFWLMSQTKWSGHWSLICRCGQSTADADRSICIQ